MFEYLAILVTQFSYYVHISYLVSRKRIHVDYFIFIIIDEYRFVL